jgi:hypothetical protein
VVSGFYYLKLSVFQYHHKKGEKAKKSPSIPSRQEVFGSRGSKQPQYEIARFGTLKNKQKIN